MVRPQPLERPAGETPEETRGSSQNRPLAFLAEPLHRQREHPAGDLEPCVVLDIALEPADDGLHLLGDQRRPVPAVHAAELGAFAADPLVQLRRLGRDPPDLLFEPRDVAGDPVGVHRRCLFYEVLHRGSAAQLGQTNLFLPELRFKLPTQGRPPLGLGQLLDAPAPGLDAHRLQQAFDLRDGPVGLSEPGLFLVALLLQGLALGLRFPAGGQPALEFPGRLFRRAPGQVLRDGACQRRHVSPERLGIAVDPFDALLQDLGLPQLVEEVF